MNLRQTTLVAVLVLAGVSGVLAKPTAAAAAEDVGHCNVFAASPASPTGSVVCYSDSDTARREGFKAYVDGFLAAREAELEAMGIEGFARKYSVALQATKLATSYTNANFSGTPYDWYPTAGQPASCIGYLHLYPRIAGWINDKISSAVAFRNTTGCYARHWQHEQFEGSVYSCGGSCPTFPPRINNQTSSISFRQTQ